MHQRHVSPAQDCFAGGTAVQVPAIDLEGAFRIPPSLSADDISLRPRRILRNG